VTLSRRRASGRPTASRAARVVIDIVGTGGSGGNRTRDQRIKSPLLYQLSYRPAEVDVGAVVDAVNAVDAVPAVDIVSAVEGRAPSGGPLGGGCRAVPDR
jgi:hypothetical protein